MIDKRYIGHTLPPFTALAEPGRLRFFVKATGQMRIVTVVRHA